MRILIIEDNLAIAEAIKDGLVQEAFAVDVCHDGEEGYRVALHEPYDLIILDVMLPGMDGVTIAKKLREAAKTIRFLMLSAKDQTIDKIGGLQAGADDYMVKPFSFAELLARIQALLRRPAEAHGQLLTAGDLTLDTVTRQASRAHQPIMLSAKEYALLEYLLRNKGRTISKQDLVAHVWDFDADILPHTVEAFVGLLRAKIDKPFAGPPLIQTVRGFGYKVSDPL